MSMEEHSSVNRSLPATAGLSGFSQQDSKVLLFNSRDFVRPELYKAIKNSTGSHIVADDDEPKPSTESNGSINLLCSINFKDANDKHCERGQTLSAVSIVKDFDSTDAPAPKAFYHDEFCMRVIYSAEGLIHEELKLTEADNPPRPPDEFILGGMHREPCSGTVGEFRPVIGGIVAAVVSKDGPCKYEIFATEKELVEQVKRNKTTGPDWQFTIADVTINQEPSATPYPIAMFYYAEKLSHDRCYYMIPDPNHYCVKLSEAPYDEESILHHRLWSNSYPTS